MARTSFAGSSRTSTGDVFTRREMRESQRKLYGMELFEFANIESKEDKTQQLSEVPTRVTVAEGKHRRLTTGIGYGSEEKARATLRWDHLNFFGGARHAGVEAKWSSLDRGVRLEYTEPYFLSSHFSLNFEGRAWQAVEPVYSLELARRPRRRSATRPTRRTTGPSRSSTSSSAAASANAGLEDFTIRNNLIALGLDPRDGRDARHDGRRRLRHQSEHDQQPARRQSRLRAHRPRRTGRQVAVGHLQLLGSHWRGAPLHAGRAVVRLGQPPPPGHDRRARRSRANVPFFKRYFLGGATSIRGWGRFEVSPLSGFGLPIGGLSMLEGSSEVRKPLFGKLGGVGVLRLRQRRRADSLRFSDGQTCVMPPGPGCAT